MATNTYVALDTRTIGTATSSITFTGISQAYTDLIAVVSMPASGTVTTAVRFNGDTSTNYSTTLLVGSSGGAASYRESTKSYGITGGLVSGLGANSNFILQIQNYSNATTFKTSICRSNSATNSEVSANIILWRKTPEAITSISFIDYNGGTNTYPVGTTVSLYGILAEGVSPAPKATGGAIYSDSLYYYHVFASTGVFTPSTSITADVLQTAGGGGGGGAQYEGGGGGAGGVLAFASQSLTATNYAVTVGAGGPGGANASRGTNGNNSQFASLTASVGGGSGGNRNSPNGASGGSGGGGTYNGGTAGGNTSGQGFAGGAYVGGGGEGAGGGGAGAAGSNNTANVKAGDGGAGLSTVTNWGSLSNLSTNAGIGVNGFIAGGGGGGANGAPNIIGTGGSGGGGNGNVSGAGVNAVSFTGSGGGGAGGSASAVGGNGASGVVIVRYLKV
jgi:hypothetical protein